jgi:hypothetical protein
MPARARWGLTGTAPVHEVADVDQLARILRVQVGGDVKDARRFVGTFLRTSQHDVALEAPVEHSIDCRLSHEEQALYQSKRFEVNIKYQGSQLV